MGPTEPEAPPPLVVYDGDCSFCVGTARWLSATGLVPRARLRAYQDLEAPLAERAWSAGVRNELVALDPGSERGRAGVRGILWALEGSRARPFARLAARWPFVGALSVAYRLVAYNRRVLAPRDPRRRVECACEPDFHAGYRAALVALLALGAAALAFAAGSVSELPWRPVASAGARGLEALVVLGGGWPVAALLALRLPAGRRADGIGQLAVAAALGALTFAPYVLVAVLGGGADQHALLALSTAVSATVVAGSLHRRALRAGLGRAFGVLAAAAVLGWSALALLVLALR